MLISGFKCKLINVTVFKLMPPLAGIRGQSRADRLLQHAEGLLWFERSKVKCVGVRGLN